MRIACEVADCLKLQGNRAGLKGIWQRRQSLAQNTAVAAYLLPNSIWQGNGLNMFVCPKGGLRLRRVAGEGIRAHFQHNGQLKVFTCAQQFYGELFPAHTLRYHLAQVATLVDVLLPHAQHDIPHAHACFMRRAGRCHGAHEQSGGIMLICHHAKVDAFPGGGWRRFLRGERKEGQSQEGNCQEGLHAGEY